MSLKPWYTSNDIIDSIKRKISLPTSQSLFTSQEILNFVNEELILSQVPSVMQFHEEFFVNGYTTPLVANKTHYAIPNRAIGLKIRSIFYEDNPGSLLEMSRIDPQNQAFFSRDSGTRTNIYKYYLEGNDVVLVPDPGPSVTGSLVMNYFQRPNLLVPNEEASTIKSFQKTITVNSVVANDTITITPPFFPLREITSITTGTTVTITANNHGLLDGQTVDISETNCIPAITGEYEVSGCTNNTFTIDVGTAITVAGSNGIAQKTDEYILTASGAAGTNPFTTAATLASRINLIGLGSPESNTSASALTATHISANDPAVVTVIEHGYNDGDLVLITASDSTPVIDGIYMISDVTEDSFTVPVVVTTSGTTATVTNITDNFLLAAVASGDVVTVFYPYLSSTFEASNGSNLKIQNTQTIFVDDIPTNLKPGSKVDFLQTQPGHKTLSISVPLVNGSTNKVLNTIQFNSNQLSDEILVGDYICSEYKCIIPYLPPDLHNGLAERAAARILASIGDTSGLEVSLQKIKDIDSAQGTLIDNRVEGNPMKILNRTSPLRMGKYTVIRRP